MNALRALNLAVLAWAPLDWSLYPTARDFFLQWEAGDMTRVLALGRRW